MVVAVKLKFYQQEFITEYQILKLIVGEILSWDKMCMHFCALVDEGSSIVCCLQIVIMLCFFFMYAVSPTTTTTQPSSTPSPPTTERTPALGK